MHLKKAKPPPRWPPQPRPPAGSNEEGVPLRRPTFACACALRQGVCLYFSRRRSCTSLQAYTHDISYTLKPLFMHVRWPRGIRMVYVWYTDGIRWYTGRCGGTRVVYGHQGRGIRVVYGSSWIWYTGGILLVYVWYTLVYGKIRVHHECMV